MISDQSHDSSTKVATGKLTTHDLKTEQRHNVPIEVGSHKSRIRDQIRDWIRVAMDGVVIKNLQQHQLATKVYSMVRV